MDVDGLDHNGGVSTFSGTTYGDDLLVGAHQACVGSHGHNLASHLHALSKKPEGVGHDVVQLGGVGLEANSPTDTAQAVGSSVDYGAQLMYPPSIFLG